MLKITQIYFLTVPEARSPKSILLGKIGCQQDYIPLYSLFRGEYVSLTFTTFGGHLHSVAHGAFFCCRSQQQVASLNLSVSLNLPLTYVSEFCPNKIPCFHYYQGMKANVLSVNYNLEEIVKLPFIKCLLYVRL